MNQKKLKSLEDDINDFLKIWDRECIFDFIKDILYIFELYDVENESDWITPEIAESEENIFNVRIIRTVYLLSKISEKHAARMYRVNCNFKNLWKRMERVSEKEQKK